MIDERFDHDLRRVLRDIAGPEASSSLRSRLFEVTAQPSSGRLAWFAAPMRVAALAVVAVAVVVAAIIFVPRPVVGPTPSNTESPTATPSASAIPSPTPTAEPTTSSSASGTPAPSANPVSAWTGIAWSAPVKAFPNETLPSTTIRSVLPWRGAFVAVGSVSHGPGPSCAEVAFLRSQDGLRWTITQRVSSTDECQFPDLVVESPGGLLAVGQQRLWSSSDGTTWAEIDSPSWRALWNSDPPQGPIRVASGPAGVVAIGTTQDRQASIVAHSVDGQAWERVVLPAREQPIVRDVVAFSAGFVIGGRDGQPDDWNHCCGVVPGVGRPAAWFSSDGVRWNAATVEGERVQGGALTQVLVGSQGLFAVGVNTVNAASDAGYPNTDYSAGDVVAAWTSTDGSSWQVAGALGRDLPPLGGLWASDGTHMVALGFRESAAFLGIDNWVEPAPTAWTSTDGRHWTSLTVSGQAPSVGFLGLDPPQIGAMPDSGLWVIGDRLLEVGAGDGVPINDAGQWFRVAAAIEP